MRTRALAILIVLFVAAQATMVYSPVEASPADEYSGPYFGTNNFPPGCTRSMSTTDPDNICHRMRTGLNALDSPQVDVLVLVPVSPTAERDMRIMRQSVEMWEGGIDYLSDEIGLDWLAEGMDFHITVDYIDPAGGEGGELTTYPVVDPEIVVIATNPVGGIGIGVDPVDFVFTNEDLVPCHNVENPVDFEYWENLPGFDSHHESRTGTYYKEDCDGAGGNICFAINGAIDPAPEKLDVFGLFDLVSHEFGHCLTLGHVGDGAEGDWGAVPTNDIMAYSQDPPDGTKCVSTLDVEGVALRMSKYLDVNGDGAIDGGDLLLANDQIGDRGNPFQVQHPWDHLYASATGSPLDCPQPDLGLVPGARTDWTPTPVETTAPELTVTEPEDGSVSADGTFDVTGTVEHVSLNDGATSEPTEPVGSFDDADDDASTPLTEVLRLDVEVTPTHVDATISLADLWPSTDVASPTTYSLTIDGRQFDSFVRYAVDDNPRTWDRGATAYMPDGTSSWDLEEKTVTFHIPRDYLAAPGAGIEAPYFVASQANVGLLTAAVVDDRAPEAGETVGVAAARVVDLAVPQVASSGKAETVTFEHGGENGNTFYPEQSTGGATTFVGIDPSHHFSLNLRRTSDIELTMTWTDNVGGRGADLDLYVSGARTSSAGATLEHPETVVLEVVQGALDIRVEPFLVTDPVDGATYTLTATITPSPDADGDGVADGDDACPEKAAAGPNGCPAPAATEHVSVYVDGALAGSQDVDTAYGPDAFDITVNVAEGSHELRIDWEDDGGVVASRSITVTYDPDGDGDGDLVRNSDDNCPYDANADQADMDGDGRGDVCDPDMDGDGHSNGKEEAHGTDPADPESYPSTGGAVSGTP